MVFLLLVLLVLKVVSGCPKCGLLTKKQKRTLSFEDNLNDFKRIHNDLYSYPESTNNTYNKIKIVCNVVNHRRFLYDTC